MTITIQLSLEITVIPNKNMLKISETYANKTITPSYPYFVRISVRHYFIVWRFLMWLLPVPKTRF